MSGAMEIVGSSAGRVQNPAVPTSAPSSIAASSAPVTANPIRNINVIQDPSAGFITEYLSTHGGQVILQVPSAITVAYLRQGLSADGMLQRTPSSGSVTTTV